MFILGRLSISVIFMDFGLSPVMIMKFFLLDIQNYMQMFKVLVDD